LSRRTIARRELSSLSREKTIVLALVIQLVIAGFSSFLVVGLTSMYDPDASAADLAVGVTGEEADRLVAAVDEVEGLTAVEYGDLAESRAAFQRDEVQAVAEVSRFDGRIELLVEAPQEGLQRTLLIVQLREAFETLERTERTERSAHLEFEPVPRPGPVDASPYFGFSYTVLLPLLVFLPVFISGAVVVDSLTEEIERGTLELLRVAPLSLVTVAEGKAAALAALAPVQVALWVALLEYNGISVSNAAVVLALASAAAVVAVSLAVFLAIAVPTRQRAQLTYSFAALALFAAAATLPEHPATTVARLTIDSATTGTYLHVAGYVLVAALIALAVRTWVARIDPESLG